jgi:hypothetical protein
MIEAKAFRTFIRTYFLFKSERLSNNIKLTLHKALIWSVMTYACPAWEFAVDTYLLKLQRLQNKVLCTIGNFPRRTPTRDIHVAFKILLQNYAGNRQRTSKTTTMKTFVTSDKAKPNTENIRGSNLAAVKLTIAQVYNLPIGYS